MKMESVCRRFRRQASSSSLTTWHPPHHQNNYSDTLVKLLSC
jgi:hypothetical protein